jgi:hypothetical protein
MTYLHERDSSSKGKGYTKRAVVRSSGSLQAVPCNALRILREQWTKKNWRARNPNPKHEGPGIAPDLFNFRKHHDGVDDISEALCEPHEMH